MHVKAVILEQGKQIRKKESTTLQFTADRTKVGGGGVASTFFLGGAEQTLSKL